MEEVNDLALTELIPSLIVEENEFDYGDITPEQKTFIKQVEASKGVVAHFAITTLGGGLKGVQQIYSHHYNGIFVKWVEQIMKIPMGTARKYIQAFDVLQNLELVPRGTNSNQIIENLGVHKLSYLAKLSPEQQNIIVDKASLEELNVDQVRELTKKVKESGEYSDQLVEEIRQKDQKLKEEKMQQIEKDNKIAELQQKIKELEEKNVQPVAQDEPEVVEKIVEVERIVEKEVVPNEIKEELEILRNENKVLMKDNKEKASFIEGQNNTIIEQRQKISSLQIDDTILEDSLSPMKLGSLLSFIDCFLRDTSGFALLKGQFSTMSTKSKETLLSAINRVEDWCMLMKQAINNDKGMLGNNIIIESEND